MKSHSGGAPTLPAFLCVSLGLLSVLLMPPSVAAQSIPLPIVTVSLATNSFEAAPPFDQMFAISVKLPSGIRSITLKYGPGRYESNGGAYSATFSGVPSEAGTAPDEVLKSDVAVFLIAPLPPNKEYVFQFTLNPAPADNEPKPLLNRSMDSLLITTRKVDERVSVVGLQPFPVASAGPPSTGQPTTPRQVNILTSAPADIRKHFDLDFGVLWAPRPGPAAVAASSNVHVYFTPINKNETRGGSANWFREEILKRVSLFAGLSVATFTSGETVEKRFDAGNLVTGIGVRPRFRGKARGSDFFRINGGFIFFQQPNANPLIADKVNAHAPFVSVTGDIDLQAVLGPIVTFLGIR